MLKTPTRVSINSPMPSYDEKQDHKSYVSMGDFKATLPRAPKGTLPLGNARSLGAFSNIPRLATPSNWVYKNMFAAEKRLGKTWAAPFMEDVMFAGFSGPPFIDYKPEPEQKQWNKALPYYENEIGSVPRKYYPDVAPFVPTATNDIFVSEDGKLRPPFAKCVLADTSVPAARPKSDNGLGSLWTDIVSTGNVLLKTAGDIYGTYQAGEIAKAQSQIVQAQAQATQAAAAQTARAKSTLLNYLPWVVGGALILKFLIGKKK